MVVALTIKEVGYALLGLFDGLVDSLRYLYLWHQILWLHCMLYFGPSMKRDYAFLQIYIT